MGQKFANAMTDQGLISKIHKRSSNSVSKKKKKNKQQKKTQATQSIKWKEDLSRHFSK